MSAPELCYEVAALEPRDHRVHVRFTVRGEGLPEPLTVAMPVWAPGSYFVREFARHVEALRATGDGVRAGVRKLRKDAWAIAHGGAREVTVSYVLYARDLTVRTNYLDETFLWLHGAATFLHLESSGRDWDALPCTLTLTPREGWHVVTALEPLGDGVYRARDFHQLVDTPVYMGGTAERRTFTVAGREHVLVVEGHELAFAYDGARLLRDVARVVEAAVALYGDVPYARYVFHVLFVPGARGGLEHACASAVMASPDVFETEAAWCEFLALVAHEFLHLWHVKRVRPAGLVPVDYARENYTRLLWLFEGGTSYLERRLLLAAGLLTPARFLRHFADEIAALEDTPGRHLQSLEDASFDAWIKRDRPDENTPNSTVSYYRKGALVCLLLDLTIRARSEGKHSFDDVLRYLWRAYGSPGRPVPESGVEALVAEATGLDVSDLLDRCVRSTQPLPYDTVFALAGLALRPRRVSGITLGLRTRSEAGRLYVSTVLRGSPGARAGVAPGDEILALAGRRVDETSLRERLRRGAALAGRPLPLLLSRRERILTLTIVPVDAAPDTVEIFLADDASPTARLLAEWWLDCAREAP